MEAALIGFYYCLAGSLLYHCQTKTFKIQIDKLFIWIDNYLWLFMIIYLCGWLFVIIGDYLRLFVIIDAFGVKRCFLWLFVIICGYLWLLMIICDYMWLFIGAKRWFFFFKNIFIIISSMDKWVSDSKWQNKTFEILWFENFRV